MLNEIEARIKAKIEAAGTPLKDWDVNIYRGILTGFNDAFIIDEATKNDLIKKSPKSAEIIRPILRGEDIKRFHSQNLYWLVNTHNGIPKKSITPVNVKDDYDAVFKYLQYYEKKLAARQDQGSHWTNLRSCAYQNEFAKTKIIWGNLNSKPNFTIDYDGNFIASPSVMLVSADSNIEYFLAVLNSAVCKFFVKQLSYARENGYIEYQKQFVEQLPVPNISKSTQSMIASLVKKIVANKKDNLYTKDLEAEIDNFVFDAFRLNEQEIAYLESC